MAKKVDKNEQPSALNQEPVDAPERFLDADGNPTADEFSEKPDTVSGKTIRTRNRMRPESTHGTIAADPYGPLDSLSIRRENAGPREIKSNQMNQVGEDPGRVFDSSGLHPQAAAQHVAVVNAKLARPAPPDTPGLPADVQGPAASDVPPATPTPTPDPAQPGSGEPLIS